MAFIAAIDGAVGFGNSISEAVYGFASLPYNVTFKMEIENYTDCKLDAYQNHTHSGYVTKPLSNIMPGIKEGIFGHKTGDTATGCVGTASWKIEGTGKMMVIMYSVPYDHNWYSNWCGVGIFDIDDTKDYFNMMYNKSEINFCRKDFYKDTNPVEFKGSGFVVKASMGTSHKAEIIVKLFPELQYHIAPSLRHIVPEQQF